MMGACNPMDNTNHKVPLVKAARIGLALIGLVACRNSSGPPSPSPAQEQMQSTTVHVVPESVSIKQNEFASFKVVVPPDATNGHIDGQFSAEPRPYAQVDMVMIKEAGYRDWRAYAADALIYHTGNTSADKFDLPLAPGNYYLIFDNNLPSEAANTFDSDPRRIVDAQIRLVYDRRF